jgi:hypothetical protein
LTRDGVSGYVAHRLQVAGGTPDRVQFTDAALDEVYVVSKGVPRVVNLICDRALQHGHRERANHIQPRLIARAAEDLGLVPRDEHAPAVTAGFSIPEKIEDAVTAEEPVVTAPPLTPAPLSPAMPPMTPKRVEPVAKPLEVDDGDFDLETMIEPENQELEEAELFGSELPEEELMPEPDFSTPPPASSRSPYQGSPGAPTYGGPERRRLLATYADRVEPEAYAPRGAHPSGRARVSQERELDEFYDTSSADMLSEPPQREGLQRHLRVAAGVLVAIALVGWIGQMAFGVLNKSDEADAAGDLPKAADVSLSEPQQLQLVPAPTALVGNEEAATVTPPSAAPAPPVPAPTPIAPTGAQWYVVQVASFTQLERAESLVAELIGQGLPAYRVTLRVDGGPLYVVLLGRYSAMSQAESAAARVRSMPGYADAKIQALAPRPPAQN